MTCLLREFQPTQIQDSRGYAYVYRALMFCGNSVALTEPQTGYPSPITVDPSCCTCNLCFDAYMFHHMSQAESLRERKRAWVQRCEDQEQRHAAERALVHLAPMEKAQ